MMPGHRYRCRIVPVAEGGYVLTLTDANGHGGAQHHPTLAEALAGVEGLYAAITSKDAPTRGEAADGPRGRFGREAA